MLNYRVGMKVMIDPELRETNWSFGVTEEMVSYSGDYATITSIRDDIYNIDIDDGYFNWDKAWSKPAALNKGR